MGKEVCSEVGDRRHAAALTKSWTSSVEDVRGDVQEKPVRMKTKSDANEVEEG